MINGAKHPQGNETLGQKQRAFAIDVAQLIVFAYQNGFEVTFGDAYRDPEVAQFYAQRGRGISNSLHCQRLAIDLNLFINGVYQSDGAAHRPLGEFWEALRPGNCWGGRFGDGNHYSRSHDGRK